MKKFDKFILWLFSLIMLSNVIFAILLVFDLFGAREILEKTPKTYYALISTDKDAVIASIALLVLMFILSLKGFMFQSKNKKDKTDGILLENNNGKLLISRETLENLVRDISKKNQGTESIHSKIYLDDNNEIVVNINAVVYQDAIIKEVTKRMQEDIKNAIKQASDLEVAEVNVNIEKISNKQSPEFKAREETNKQNIKETKKIENAKKKLLETETLKEDSEKVSKKTEDSEKEDSEKESIEEKDKKKE